MAETVGWKELVEQQNVHCGGTVDGWRSDRWSERRHELKWKWRRLDHSHRDRTSFYTLYHVTLEPSDLQDCSTTVLCTQCTKLLRLATE